MAHRPYPPPRSPWVMTQTWYDLLFAHWALPPDELRPTLPAALRAHLDAFDGQAWIGVVPFRMRSVRARGVPGLPWLSAFPELNVRTYVTLDGEPGVFFYSLDAGNPVAVAAARRFYHLPYFNAMMKVSRSGDRVRYDSRRTHRAAPPARLDATYGPVGPRFEAALDSLDHWLTARYCLYAHDAGAVYRAEIHHAPWPLQPATAELSVNTMAESHGIRLPERPPLLHFADCLQMVAWLPERIR
jgi:uncharacterized protein